MHIYPILRHVYQPKRREDDWKGIEEDHNRARYILIRLSDDLHRIDIAQTQSPTGQQPNHEEDGVDEADVS